VAKQLPSWLGNLDLRGRLLVHLGSAQSRFESAMVARFRSWWPQKAIRLELRAMQHEQLIDLMALDRVRWALTAGGRSAAQRARVAAKQRTAA
jgi:hypothetical protein